MGKTYCCAEHYRCATALYLMSVLSQAFSVVIDRGISAPGHNRYVVYGLNTIEKRFLFQLMSTVQLLCATLKDGYARISCACVE